MRRLLMAALVLLAGWPAAAQTTTTRTDRLAATQRVVIGASTFGSTSPLQVAGLPAKGGQTSCAWLDASGNVYTGTCGTVTSVGLSAPGIFSVSGSPVTSSGTLALALANQNANLVFAGPTSGGAAAPTFRSLVKADHPAAVVFDDDANTFSAAGTALTVTNNAAFGGIASSLIPSLTDTFNLGSSFRLWNEGFVSQLNAVIYAEQTATLFGGWSVIGKNAGTFAAAVGAADTSINFGKAMTNGHFIVVRAHDTSGTVRAEHMQITGTTGCTTCTVTRGLNTGGTGYAFAQGTSYLVSGTTGDGRIELRAYTTPQISILSQGEAYNTQTEHVRIGYLDGAAGMGATTGKVGIVIGDASQYLRYYDGVLTIAGNGSGITSIHGGNIQTDTITATQIAANAITASEIAADAVTAAKIAATAIDGKTITGATIRTASSGARVEMNSSNLRAIDSGGNTLLTLDGTGIVIDQPTAGSVDAARAFKFAASKGLFGFRSGTTLGSVWLQSGESGVTNNELRVFASNGSGASGGLLATTAGTNVTVKVEALAYPGSTGTLQLSGTLIQANGGIYPGDGASYQSTGWWKWNSTYTNHEFSHDVQAPGVMLNNWQAAPGGARVVCTGATSAGADNWIYFGVDGTQCNSSSARYKDHVAPAQFDFSRILDARPVTFEYKALPGVPQFGLIAEDVDALGLEPLVVRSDSGQVESVAYDKVALYLIPVLREQRARVETLERRLAVLEAKR